MGLNLDIGSSDFKIVSKADYYVDKTAMLIPLMERCQSGSSLIFNRPRRFGKSLALSMMETFFSDSTIDALSYFKDRAVMKADITPHLSQYKVIRLSFSDVSEDPSFDTKGYLKRKIAEIYRSFYPYFEKQKLSDDEIEAYQRIMRIEDDETSYMFALKRLSELIHREHGKKPIVLIDEYDLLLEKRGVDDGADFYKAILTSLLKDNEHLGMGILTGVFSLAKGSLGFGLNNIPVDNGIVSLIDKNYFGFEEEDVSFLLSRYGRKSEEINLLKEYYGGYCFNEKEYFNPWSIVSYLNTGVLMGYWVDSARKEAFYFLVEKMDDEGFRTIDSLMQGEEIIRQLDFTISYENYLDSTDNILLYLAMAGYLSIRQVSFTEFSISITNKETLSAFSSLFYHSYKDKEGLNKARELRKAFIEGDAKKIAEILESFLLSALSYYDFSNEKTYQIMVGTLASIVLEDYLVRHEVIAGEGRCDILIAPREKKDFGAVIELKNFSERKSKQRLESSAMTALKQIQKKGYAAPLISLGVKEIYGYGIAFYKNRVAVISKKLV
ncbi:MAG: AAA family ATPase [Bacilli bacterium]|nr:AAA family ATPase [Bacilli bacterium]